MKKASIRKSEEGHLMCFPMMDGLRFGPLANMISFHLRLAQLTSHHAFARRLDHTDVSSSWFAILALIGANPGITQTALSRADSRDKSGLTPILDELDRRGLVTRERLSGDRRSYSLNLTQAGVKLLDALMEQARAHERELDQIIGPERKADLICTLQRIATAFLPAQVDNPAQAGAVDWVCSSSNASQIVSSRRSS